LKNYFKTIVLASVASIVLCSHKPDEGMFPLSELNKIDFKKAGFKISQQDIFNPGGVSLANALVRIDGCTGSFISDEGLIITNHHCVFGAVSSVSSVKDNYLENGFVAKSKDQEIPVKMECKITRSYEDVSSKILQGIEKNTKGEERATIIKKNMDELIKEESKLHKDLKIEISEMFLGRSYVLFRYEILKDVRLVYIPPRQVGEFGGESDNWEWPRHTGDFSIVRAYSNKENKAADFSKENKPYKPARFLKINANGVQENDLVFILGYPGRTFRHQPSVYIEYQQDELLPYIANWYDFKIQTMMNVSRNIGDEARYLTLASNIKSLANVKKNYEGKMQGLGRTGLLGQKRNEDIDMTDVAKEQGMDSDFFKVVAQLDSIYAIKQANANQEFTFSFLLRDVPYYATAFTLEKLKRTALNIPENKKDSFWNANKALIQKSVQGISLENKDLSVIYFRELLKKLEKENVLPMEYVQSKNKDKWLNSIFAEMEKNKAKWNKMIEKPSQFAKTKSKMQNFANQIIPQADKISSSKEQTDASLNVLIPIYTELKNRTYKGVFFPDANSTIRLTYGYIKRYEPNDAEVHMPLSSLEGILQKNATGNKDYYLPEYILDFYKKIGMPRYLTDKNTGKSVVCMLYNLDTTGGNSGSPIMDAEGNLVGINFDRTYTATINDFAWNENYSRSVGVDMRYVLYMMKYFSGADHLLEELGQNN